MAVTHYDLTATFLDPEWAPFTASDGSIVAWIETNVGSSEGIVDTVANAIALGGLRKTVDSAGAVSWTNLVGSDSDPADIGLASGTLQYRVTAEYHNPITRRRDRWLSGWFSLTADVDLADVVAEQYIPAEWITTAVATLQGYVDDAQAARDAALAAEAAAEAAGINEATVTALAPGSDPTVVITGTHPNRSLDLGLPGATADDATVAPLISGAGGAGPLTRAALSASYAGITSATLAAQPFLKKIKRNVEDAVLLFLGDSTMYKSTDWPHKLIEAIAPDWPTHTFVTKLFNDTTHVYDAFDTVQTGTGARTVTVYLGCVPGWKFTDVLAPDFDNLVRAIDADLIVIGLGHNEADAVANDFRNRYVTGVETVAEARPAAEIICVAPNPRSDTEAMAYKAQRIERYCAQRGRGFIDVHQMYKDLGDYTPYILNDTLNLHPNPAGSLLIAAFVARYFKYHPEAAPPGRSTSTLLEPTENLATDPLFLTLDASNVPAGMTATDLVITRDITDFETGDCSLLLTDAGAASVSHLQEPLSAKFVAGHWVTLAARVKIDTDQGASAGNVALGDASGITTSLGESGDKGKGGWRWETITRYFPPGVTAPYYRIYADSSSVSSRHVKVDRVIIARGLWPRDHVFGAGKKGDTGAQGVSATGGMLVKTLDEGRTSNALVADAELKDYPVEANSDYDIHIYLPVDSASDVPDFKNALQWPADASDLTWFEQSGLAPSGTSSAGSISRARSTVSGVNPGSIMATSVTTGVEGHAFLRTVSAGVVSLLWGQAVTNATPTYVRKGAIMTVTKRSAP